MPTTLTTHRTRRPGLVASCALAVSAILSGCAAGSDAQTLQPYQPAEGTNAESGPIAVRNLVVLADDGGTGEIHATFVNSGDAEDRLTAIKSATGSDAVQVGGMRPFTIPAGGTLTLPPQGGPPVTVSGAEPGRMIELTLTFGSAGPITADVAVLATDHYSPTPAP